MAELLAHFLRPFHISTTTSGLARFYDQPMQRKRWLTLRGGAGLLACLACLLIVILFTARTPANPRIDPSATVEARLDVPHNVAATLRRACFDCHSNNTRWPWYSQIPPGLWMVSHDVNRAREVMNFSAWPEPLATTSKAPGLLLAACAVLRAELMPPQRYLVLHPEARLSQAEIDAVCDWSRTQASQIAAARRRARQARQPAN